MSTKRLARTSALLSLAITLPLSGAAMASAGEMIIPANLPAEQSLDSINMARQVNGLSFFKSDTTGCTFTSRAQGASLDGRNKVIDSPTVVLKPGNNLAATYETGSSTLSVYTCETPNVDSLFAELNKTRGTGPEPLVFGPVDGGEKFTITLTSDGKFPPGSLTPYEELLKDPLSRSVGITVVDNLATINVTKVGFIVDNVTQTVTINDSGAKITGNITTKEPVTWKLVGPNGFTLNGSHSGGEFNINLPPNSPVGEYRLIVTGKDGFTVSPVQVSKKPDPEPTPDPNPGPNPNPAPNPGPGPEPAPNPAPYPGPQPAPDPAPVPLPIPVIPQRSVIADQMRIVPASSETQMKSPPREEIKAEDSPAEPPPDEPQKSEEKPQEPEVIPLTLTKQPQTYARPDFSRLAKERTPSQDVAPKITTETPPAPTPSAESIDAPTSTTPEPNITEKSDKGLNLAWLGDLAILAVFGLIGALLSWLFFGKKRSTQDAEEVEANDAMETPEEPTEEGEES